MTEAEKERERMADTLLAAARAFYGQGFKTDRKYWLALAEAANNHKGHSDNGGC